MPYILEDAVSSELEREKIRNVFEKIKAEDKRKFWIFKRSCDIIFSGFALLAAFLPMLMITLCIFISDGHNPFFKQ